MANDILVKVGADISNFSRNISKATQDVSSLGKTSNGLTFGKLLGAVGITAAVAKGFNMVKESVGRAFGRIDTMEQFERVMTTMTGSADKANDVLAKTNDIVTGTAYGLDVGAKAVQNFVTSNMDVDKATDAVAAWGDAVAFYGDGTNETFASVSDALAQMTAKGKVQMDTMNRLSEAGIPAMQIFADATGQSVEEVATKMQKGQLKAEEFNDVMIKALNDGTKNFEGIKGAAKEAGASWSGSFDNMKAAIARGVTAIVQGLDEMLTSNGLPDMRQMVANFGKKFEEVLKKAAEAIPALVDKLKEVYNTLEPWMPLIKGVALAIGTFVAAVATVNSIISIATGIWRAFNLVLMMNPWVALAAAIVAAAVLIYVYWEPIKAFFINLWEKIKVAGIAVWDWLKGVWQSTVEFFVNLWTGISEFFSNLWTGIVEVATSIWDSIVEKWNSVVAFVKEIFGPMLDYFSELWTNIVSTATEIWGILTETLSTVWTNIQTIAAAAWEIIKNVILGPILLLVNLATGNFEGFKSNLKAIWENIKSAAKTIWEALKSNVSTIIDALIKIGKSLWEGFKTHLSNLWQALKQTASNIWNSLKDRIVQIVTNLVSNTKAKWEDLKQKVIDLAKKIVSDAVAKWEELKSKTLDKMTETKNNIINTLKNIDLLQIGKDVIQGFIKGIKSKVKDVASAAKEAADAVTGKIKSILGIHSPSRVMRDEVGVHIGTGLAAGITKSTSTVTKSATALAKTTNQRFKVAFRNAKYKFDMGKIDTVGYITALKRVRDEYAKTPEHIQKVNLAIKKAQDSATKAEQDTLKKRESALKKINDTVVSATTTYANKVADVNKKLTNDIKKANSEYNKALADRTKSIANQIGLFDKFEAKAVSRTDLIGNLRGQVQAMRDWSGNLAKIGKNAPKEFVDDLREMGLGSASEISAIAGMSKKQLDEYVKLWKQKQKAAKSEATVQLEDLKKQTTQKINDLRVAAGDQLNKLRGEYINKLKTLSDEVKKLGSFKNSGKVLGKNAVSGIINGLNSMKGPLASAAKRIANTITKTVKTTLKIKSPSRVMIALAKNVPTGVAKGIDATLGTVRQASARLTEAMTPEAPEISMAYATPSGTYDSLASAVNGSVDVDSRDSMLAGAIDDLRRDLTNLRVEMDKREVGRIVAPTVGQELNNQATQTTRGRGRRSI